MAVTICFNDFKLNQLKIKLHLCLVCVKLLNIQTITMNIFLYFSSNTLRRALFPLMSAGSLSLLSVSLLVGLNGCQGSAPVSGSSQRLLRLQSTAASPTPVPVPDFGQIPAPPENPVTQGKVELGFRLWFEPRLSANNRMTCATCHNHTMGFSNAQRNAAGVTGQRGERNVPTIYGSLWQRETFWDGRAKSLEEQALGPIENPIEMNESLPNVIKKLAQVPYYQQKFQAVFGSGPSAEGIAKAMASFERALMMAPTPFERYQAGEKQALSPEQVRGRSLFFSGRTQCASCHQGPALSQGIFANIGIGMNQPNPDLGRFVVTGMPWDKGSFKIPTLLNISRTAPYMHDGSLPTLLAVIEHYDQGGIANPELDPRVRRLNLNPSEKNELLAFLNSLSAPDNLRSLGKLPGIHLPTAEVERLMSNQP